MRPQRLCGCAGAGAHGAATAELKPRPKKSAGTPVFELLREIDGADDVPAFPHLAANLPDSEHVMPAGAASGLRASYVAAAAPGGSRASLPI